MMRKLVLALVAVGVVFAIAPAVEAGQEDEPDDDEIIDGESEDEDDVVDEDEDEDEDEDPGRIEVRVLTGRGQDRTGVEGVGVTVEGPEGATFDGATDSEGRVVFGVQVVGPDAEYVVTLDAATLPEEFEEDPDDLRREGITVAAGLSNVNNFRVGEDADRDRPSRLARVGSLAVSGVKLGAIIALAAIGLSLVFGVTGLVNFSHGELVTMGAVLAFLFNTGNAGPTWHIILAAIPAVAIVALFGWGQERVIWRPLRHRRAGNISTLVVSIGLMFAMQYTIRWIYGGQPRPFAQYAAQGPMSVFQPVNVVPKNLWIVGISVVALTVVGLMLIKTKLGTAMRAVSDNPDLARSSGIDVDRVIAITWVMGAGLAALGGVLFGVSEQVQWQMGFKLLLGIFAAVVLGGLGTAFGAMLGGFAIGFTIEVSTYLIPTELKFGVGLAALVVMLLLRPQGLLGRRERIG